jgi:hypothetical protein
MAGKKDRILKTIKVDAPSGEGKTMQVRTAMAQKDLLEALIATRGHISKACAEVGVDRQTFYNYMTDPDFAKAVENIKAGITDEYLDALHNVALDGKLFPAIKYYLDAQARDRGFGQPEEKVEKTPEVVGTMLDLRTLQPEQLKQLRALLQPKTN